MASSEEVSLLIWNVGGCSCRKGHMRKRKETIYDVIEKLKPTIVMFQEFPWKNIHSSHWGKFKLSNDFQYTGNKEASILYNEEKVGVENVPQRVLDSTLGELKRKSKVSNDFSPIPRMCLREVTMGDTNFICVSWHGPHAGLNKAKKEKTFEEIVTYVKKISKKQKLPFVLAGDFNLKMNDALSLSLKDVHIEEYKSTGRRNKDSVIDFYISNGDIIFSPLEAVTLDFNQSQIFDHDPIMTISKLS